MVNIILLRIGVHHCNIQSLESQIIASKNISRIESHNFQKNDTIENNNLIN